MDQEVTRLEIAEAVGDVFGITGAMRDEIVLVASQTGRPAVVTLLRDLPDRRYARLNELWEELRDVPVGV